MTAPLCKGGCRRTATEGLAVSPCDRALKYFRLKYLFLGKKLSKTDENPTTLLYNIGACKGGFIHFYKNTKIFKKRRKNV